MPTSHAKPIHVIQLGMHETDMLARSFHQLLSHCLLLDMHMQSSLAMYTLLHKTLGQSDGLMSVLQQGQYQRPRLKTAQKQPQVSVQVHNKAGAQAV